MHGGNERTVLEPAAGRAAPESVAQWPTGDTGWPPAAQPHRDAAGLRGGDTHVLRGRPDQTARLPLCLQTGTVPSLLDRRGGQRHPLLHVRQFNYGNLKHYCSIKGTLQAAT